MIYGITEGDKFSKLLNRVKKLAACDLEVEYDESKIMIVGNNPMPGAKVTVQWKSPEGEPDIIAEDSGYVFTLPFEDSCDIFMHGIVHIPEVTADMGGGEPWWELLIDIAVRKDVHKVIIYAEGKNQ